MKIAIRNFIGISIVLMCALQACAPAQSSTTLVPTSLPTLALTTVAHTLMPKSALTVLVKGQDASESAKQPVQGGDNFSADQLERPFTAKDMNYLPDADIQQFAVGSDDNFYYVDLQLAGVNSNGNLAGSYAAEFDLNLDGRGDVYWWLNRLIQAIGQQMAWLCIWIRMVMWVAQIPCSPIQIIRATDMKPKYLTLA